METENNYDAELVKQIEYKRKEAYKSQERLDKIISDYWKGNVGLDGIGKIESYWELNDSSSEKGIPDIKILWFLKEPVDRPNDDGTPYSYRERFTEAADATHWKTSTFGTIATVSYGLIHSFRWEKYIAKSDLPKLSMYKGEASPHADDGYETRPLDKIAIINISKLNNKNVTEQNFIISEYNKNEVKNILMSQIDYIEPEIIIIGNGVEKSAEDLAGVNIKDFKLLDYDKLKTYYYFNKAKHRLIIYTHHPSMISLVGGIEPYYDSIVKAGITLLD